jgi:hypothetical protein
MPLYPAELAWYVSGRFYKREDGALADYGYFLHLAGIEGELFSGAPGETTAHFTFAAVPFTAKPVASNGVLGLAIDPVGEFSVYLQREPQGDFDHPESFARGEEVATFRRSSRVMGTTVSMQSGTSVETVFGDNVFSARLVSSVPFMWNGKAHDLGEILSPGVTQFGTAAESPVTPPAKGYVLVLPFSGSAISLGR